MPLIRLISLFAGLLLLAPSNTAYCQTVGVVFSGGGAKAFAHVGVLKALEELHIPIDYVTGTSSGAFIAALYASGHSPSEIEAIARSEHFLRIIEGKVEKEVTHYFKHNKQSAEIASLKFQKNSPWETTLPTHLISPVALDYELFRIFTPPTASSKSNFDSLFVPFRCVASDIESKSLVTFKRGNLASAVRASMAYPFYLKPVLINDTLFFDGGLYNNFPADIMVAEFSPGVVIGSNVSENYETPDPDNIISQIKTLMVAKTDYSIMGTGVLIEPKLDGVKTFDFSEIELAIASGYEETMAQKDELFALITQRSNPDQLEARRSLFSAKMPTMEIKKVNFLGALTKGQTKYLGTTFNSKKSMNLIKFQQRYYRLFSDDKIRSVYPVAKYDDSTGYFDVDLLVQKEKDFELEFGGNFSSRPINVGFIGGKYNHLGRASTTLMANSYFGKLYGSTEASIRVDWPTAPQLFTDATFRLNRWDYFKSAATFFEDVKPSYIVQNEVIGSASVGLPISPKSYIRLEGNLAELEDEYYQSKTFTSIDTADISLFDLRSVLLEYEMNSLNRKQYASEGTYFRIAGRLAEATESNFPGSTSESDRIKFSFHRWYTLKLTLETYYAHIQDLHLGVTFEAVHSSMDEFNNYTASVLRAPAFNPTPESRTLFLETFRAYTYFALGKTVIYTVRPNLDLRLEAHIFQPVNEIIKDDQDEIRYGEPFDKRYIIGNSAVVYHSPFGPFSLQMNYYQNVPEITTEDKTPITFLFHYGYILYNKKALR